MMEPVSITITLDPRALAGVEDSYLAMLWHVAQWNPASPFDTETPGAVAERIGREIIRRWLASAPVEMYKQQGHHYFWNQLRQLGKWVDGVFVPHIAARADRDDAERGQR